jgi:alanyl aminopeptidase
VPVAIASQRGSFLLDLTPANPEAKLVQSRCSDWIAPNAGATGYYRYALAPEVWDALFKAWGSVDTATRIAAVQSLWAEVRSGALPPDVLLRELPALDADTSRLVVEQEVDVLDGIGRMLVEDEARPAFRRYVAARMRPHLRRAEEPARDEAGREDKTILRRVAVWAMGELAHDGPTLAQAGRVAEAWLRDPASVDPDVAESMVGLGSLLADEGRIEKLRAAALSAKTPQDRNVALRALGGFGSKEVLLRALDVAIGPDARAQDVAAIVWAAAGHREQTPLVMDWIVSRWDAIRQKLPDALSGSLFGLASLTCTTADEGRMREFFGHKTREVEGTARPLALALEKADLCVALRAKQAPTVTRALLGKK